jgi:acyl-CoA thioesterase-1
MDARSPAPSRMIARNLLALAAVALAAACRAPSPPAEVLSRAAPTPDDRPLVVFLGDSLTAGYGLDPSQAYPALVQSRIDAAGLGYRAVNAGVSGETSAGALRRVEWLLRQEVAVLVVETGGNDGLRGQEPKDTRANLQAILDRAKKQSPPPKLVIAGMETLPNYGEDYRRRFRALYPEIAQRNGAVLIPFLLEGVGGVPSLNQADGIHPTAEGQEKVADTVWKALRPLL